MISGHFWLNFGNFWSIFNIFKKYEPKKPTKIGLNMKENRSLLFKICYLKFVKHFQFQFLLNNYKAEFSILM